jgi:nitroreductase / dihydropteridine reductase
MVRQRAGCGAVQPFEIIVVTSKAVREQIKPIAWNQAQITDGSHLLVFAAWDHYTAERINHMFDLTNAQRGFTNEGWENYRQMLLKNYPQRDAAGELRARRPPGLHRPGCRADRRGV